MKKSHLTTICSIFMMFLFIACSNNVQAEAPEHLDSSAMAYPLYPLFFNTPELFAPARVSPVPNSDFHHPLSQEQLDAVFPLLNLPLRAQAYYRADGTLVEISACILFSDADVHPYNREIEIGIGGRPIFFHKYIFHDDVILESSYVHGIPVTTLMIDWEGTDRFSFQATFILDDNEYRISFQKYDKESGQLQMTEIVNSLILGGTEVFDILLDPIIPELRSDFLSLDEARLDPDFAKFVPDNVPDGYIFEFAHRSIRQHLNENSLFLDWRASYDEAYLYDIYTRWVAERTCDSPVFPFDQIFWGDNRLSWHISVLSECVLDQLVSVDNGYTLFYTPVFFAEYLTLENIQALEWRPPPTIQGAYSVGDECIDHIRIPMEFIMLEFGIIFDDILVHIRTATKDISSEVIWEMFNSLY